MDPTIFITALLLGIALGLAAGLAVGRARGVSEHAQRHTQLTADTASAQARLEETIGRVAALDSALTESQRELASCRERPPASWPSSTRSGRWRRSVSRCSSRPTSVCAPHLRPSLPKRSGPTAERF